MPWAAPYLIESHYCKPVVQLKKKKILPIIQPIDEIINTHSSVINNACVNQMMRGLGIVPLSLVFKKRPTIWMSASSSRDLNKGALDDATLCMGKD